MRRTTIIALAGILVASCGEMSGNATGSAPPDSTAGETRFTYVGPGDAAITLPVSFNGRAPVRLIMDTGATFTCLDSTLVAELGLPEQRLALGMAVGVGMAGRVRLYRADSIRVGSAVARNVTVCSMNLQALSVMGGDVRGLLGLNVLHDFHVTIDFRRHVVQLTSADSTAATPRRSTRPARSTRP